MPNALVYCEQSFVIELKCMKTKIRSSKQMALIVVGGAIISQVLGIIIVLVFGGVLLQMLSQNQGSATPVLSIIMFLMSFIPSIIGGGFSGWMMQEKGWIYGGATGIIDRLISFIPVVFSSIPTTGSAMQNIIQLTLAVLINMLVAAVGGLLGMWLQKKLNR